MSKSKNSTGLLKVVGVVALLLVALVACATIDSCNRHNKACFGITGTK